MRYQVKRVSGAQAEMVRRLGFVQVAESSARDLFDLGVPLVVAPSKVNDHHFFGGYNLATHVDSQRYLAEGKSFDVFRNAWRSCNEVPETGKIAYFVDEKHVAGRRR